MSARFSAESQIRKSPAIWLTIGLLGITIVGCQSAPLNEASHSTTARHSVPIRLVSVAETPVSSAKKPESWQLHKTQRDAAVRQTGAKSKTKALVTRTSFESELWQSDEPAPFVTTESSLCATCPLSDCEAEGECREFCIGCDLDDSLSTLWCDAQGVLSGKNGLILAAASGVAIWFREGDIDREVREKVADNSRRWGDGSQLLGKFGDIRFQAPVILSLYGYSVWSQNEELHDVMGSLMSASVITGVSVSALKLVTNTDRPSDNWMNGHYGFPSYHTASTFAIAAVLDEYYGAKVGLPAYLLAGAVGFSRLDEQDHDLSDVLFGGTLGFVIGKAVAGRHLCGNSKIQFTTYFHPTDGSPGIGGELKF